MMEKLKVYAEEKESDFVKYLTNSGSFDNPNNDFRPYNPDDIYQKEGNYSIYEEMEKDEQVDISMQLKKDLILGSGFSIVPQDEGQEDMANEIQDRIKKGVPNILAKLEEMLDAYSKGFSLTEPVFGFLNDGYLTIRDLKTRHPNSFIIHTDDPGNVVKIEQTQGFSGKRIEIDPHQLIHYINRPKYQNPYGTSDLRSAYAPYLAKKHTFRWFSIFMENAASPKPVGKYPNNSPDGFARKLHNILKKFQAKTSFVVPKGVEVDFLETKSNGEAYVKAINLFNAFIGRSLFMPDLSGFSGSETSGGSFSLGENQIKLMMIHLMKRRSNFEELINHRIIAPMVEANYGKVENPPLLKFNEVMEDDVGGFAELFLKAINGKAYVPSDAEINHFRSLIKFPEGDVERAEAAKEEETEKGEDSGDGNEEGGDNPEIEEDNENLEDEVKENRFKAPAGGHQSKVDVKAIMSVFDASIERFKNDTELIVDETFSNLVSQIKKKKIIEKVDIDKISKLNVKNLTKIKKALTSQFMDMYQSGEKFAMIEILGQKNFSEPLVDERFIRILEAETFQFIGDWEYKVSQALRIQLIEAIKDGKPIQSIIDFIDDYGRESARISLDRFARTKITEVFNKGRLNFFNEQDVVVGYQYSAILDGRTTVVCAGLHGKKFKKGTEPIPPLHFNCRSLLIPITRFEEFSPDSTAGGKIELAGGETRNITKKSIDKFIEENKGKGFSVK